MRNMLETKRGSHVPEARLVDVGDGSVLAASCANLPFREVRRGG